MKIGILTDTHENMNKIRKAVEIFNSAKVDMVLHCGDIISPITTKEFKDLKAPMHLVFGNNDGERVFLVEKFKGIGEFHQPGYEFTVGNKKGIMMHEPVGIEALAESGKYDYIIYGHTHKRDIRKIGKTLIINIGETGGWLTGVASIGILNTETDEIEVIEI